VTICFTRLFTTQIIQYSSERSDWSRSNLTWRVHTDSDMSTGVLASLEDSSSTARLRVSQMRLQSALHELWVVAWHQSGDALALAWYSSPFLKRKCGSQTVERAHERQVGGGTDLLWLATKLLHEGCVPSPRGRVVTDPTVSPSFRYLARQEVVQRCRSSLAGCYHPQTRGKPPAQLRLKAKLCFTDG
jgi:hypothetical protein